MTQTIEAASDVAAPNPYYLSSRDGPSEEYLAYARKLVASTYQTFSSLQLGYVQTPAYKPWADTENLRHANEISWLSDAATELAEEALPDLGIDPEPLRLEAEEGLDRGRKLRLATYPLTSWTEGLVFRFLYSLVLQAQAEATIGSNYIPYAVVAQKIYFRFGMVEWPADVGSPHRERIARAIREEGFDTVQRLVDRWWPLALDSFGQPESPNDEAYVRLGLKTRSNAFTRTTFEKTARAELHALGLSAPKYTH